MKKLNGNINSLLDAGEVAVQRSGTEWFFGTFEPDSEKRSLRASFKEAANGLKEWAHCKRRMAAMVGVTAVGLFFGGTATVDEQVANAETTLMQAKESLWPQISVKDQRRLDTARAAADTINHNLGFTAFSLDRATPEAVVIAADTCPRIPDTLKTPPSIVADSKTSRALGVLPWSVTDESRQLQALTGNVQLDFVWQCMSESSGNLDPAKYPCLQTGKTALRYAAACKASLRAAPNK